ncbi:helix-turn-helix domain-containing protein [Amycolatopsis jiangsuensis]|uniref:Excisionase family DNA binding protein n=1 Tax=Amycolatopsis jiangsuensis TaxID=1181879 RepID=A0A840IZX6_9PSEU|nr:helix-turn-helix domain-containing protein [Amycolatopsis jiangsuensis]MBB4687233.1 excisionase family DNA binding protein [Amycolatopsis jiangsuensis]
MDAVISPAPVPARHLYRIPEAMRLLSMSRSVIYELLRAGRLFSVKQGRARLIPAKAIQQYVDQLIQEAEVTGYGQAA